MMCDEIKSLLCPKCGSMNNLVHHLVDHEGWNEEDARADNPLFVCGDCFHACPISEVGKKEKEIFRSPLQERRYQRKQAYLKLKKVFETPNMESDESVDSIMRNELSKEEN